MRRDASKNFKSSTRPRSILLRVLMGTPGGALALVRDLLCLSLRSLECLRDQSASASDVLRAAAGIQGVLEPRRTVL